ncbi:MAG TPA: transcription elongation factor GreA [Gaiellaceae bacterium]|nr:transcription elongation factor GreA [Gaiellaceae bacterium]
MYETLITPTGLSRLCEELDRLKSTGRDEIAERIRHAISTDADPTANADYLAAREEQALHEAKIARLEQRLTAVRVVEADAANDVVDLGERVMLRDLDTKAVHEYQLVGSLEADPAAGRISAESPLGRTLIGLGAGDVVVVEAPKGQRRLRILAIEQAAAVA